MPSYTGTQLVTMALRELGVVDPVETPEPEHIAAGCETATNMLDSWRLEKLLIPAMTRTVYSWPINTASVTIGASGSIGIAHPLDIEAWSVIAPDTASPVTEVPMGKPLTWAQYQAIGQKALTGARPTRLYFDKAYASGLGNVAVWPVPNVSTVDVVLYTRTPELTALASGTTYDLRPGAAKAIVTNLAIELADQYGREPSGALLRRAATSKGLLKRAGIQPLEAPMRPEFSLGRGGADYDLYTDE